MKPMLKKEPRWYKAAEFARLAGVTVRTLHHYDRLGLLRPGRSEAGYRIYVEADLERLEQIVALKLIGLPLKEVRTVLDRADLELQDALRLQIQAPEKKQLPLGRAICAIPASDRTRPAAITLTMISKKPYDDFEEAELHSTILIDKNGRVHWARNGGDPFSDMAFLVKQVERMGALAGPSTR